MATACTDGPTVRSMLDNFTKENNMVKGFTLQQMDCRGAVFGIKARENNGFQKYL